MGPIKLAVIKTRVGYVISDKTIDYTYCVIIFSQPTLNVHCVQF